MLRQQNKKPNQTGKIRQGWLILLVVWFGLAIFVGFQRQAIADAWSLRGYKAPAPVALLAKEDAMTEYARKIFYVNHPAIDDKNNFSKSCPNNGGEQTIVLGCYHSDQAGIYLLYVSDSRLNGIHQVTAAHEMLHGAYDRLSRSDRAVVDAMLNDYYTHDLHDTRILHTIEAYKKTEPNDVTNEMHSIFGTEIASLPAPLEDYYRKYFTDRTQVTSYAARYQQEFSSRQATVNQADTKLKDLKAQIDTLQAQLDAARADIKDQQSNLDQLRADGNTPAYNAGVPVYNRMVNNYNAQLENLETMIQNYNNLVAERNAVAGEIDSLVKDLTAPASRIQ